MEEASTLRKLAPPSVVTALASMVLPVLGGLERSRGGSRQGCVLETFESGIGRDVGM